MPTYRIGLWIAHPDVIVQAKDEDEAKEIVETFIKRKNDDYKDLLMAMDVDIEDWDWADENDDYGIDKNNPYWYHRLKKEE